jgi:hypothetical protein
LQAVVDPFALGSGADGGAHESRDGQELQVVLTLNVLDREGMHAAARLVEVAEGNQGPGAE